MKVTSVMIYLVGLLTISTAKSVEAVEIKQSLDPNSVTAIAQPTKINIFNSCDQILEPVSSSGNLNKKLPNIALYTSTKNKQHSNNSEPTQASFWWGVEQFDPFDGKLIQKWFASPKKQQINLTVNWQLWTLLDYLGRYRFVNQFGTLARKHGYNLNILNQKEQCLGSYKYNSSSNPPKWELHLEKLGRDSLEVEPAQPTQKGEV
ncbi:hypothetical protein NIES4102_16310 [Chondrocystis sp. NIES-4102]|nr:hypothetical protein NIES4102_16310 [Chondrocystis sp. NIES-4102]